jgi:hypothetical protein
MYDLVGNPPPPPPFSFSFPPEVPYTHHIYTPYTHTHAVRYEDFQNRPVELCKRLFKFIFIDDRPSDLHITSPNSPYHWTQSEVDASCENLFTPPPKPTPKQRRLIDRKKIADGKAAYITQAHFPYNPSVVNKSCAFHFTQYQRGYDSIHPDVQKKLGDLDSKMKGFGYSLDPSQLFSEDKVFSRWSLFK